MIAYNETLATFKTHIENNLIVEKINQKLGFKASETLVRSFKNSLGEMYKVLSSSNVPENVQVGIEYKIPITTKRIDFIITGSDGSKNNIVIVELKQWDKVMKTDMPNTIDLGGQPHTHPSWQAYSYSAILSHFNEAIEKNDIDIKPLAFLHNYKVEFLDELTSPIYEDALKLEPVFIENDYAKLRNFIETYIKYPSKKNLLFEIEHGKIKPTKMLVDALANMLNHNQEFILIDEQKIVSERLYNIAVKAQKDVQKHVVIVEGGAGTGKSVIAIDLLGKLITQKAFTTFYVAKSSYVKENYFNQLTKNVPNYAFLKTLFKGSGSFIDSASNEFNCLIVDEAHRLTAKTKRSFMYYGENQIKEIINAAKVSVFFIDSKQSIDIKDYGSIHEIKKWAQHYHTVIHHDDFLKLKSQFRCNGSDEYLTWVDSVVYNETFESSNTKIEYDIKVFDDILDLKHAISEKNTQNKARMISGDVFPWISMKDKSQIDIKLGDFQAQWNKTKAFATDPRAVDEVGCIHTTQGMEFEYVGIIIGNDFIYKDGKIQTDYSKHPDSANEFKRPHQRKINPSDSVHIDTLIRNTYRVLLSRGQKGCYIYCMDQELSSYLKTRIQDLKLIKA